MTWPLINLLFTLVDRDSQACRMKSLAAQITSGAIGSQWGVLAGTLGEEWGKLGPGLGLVHSIWDLHLLPWVLGELICNVGVRQRGLTCHVHL